MLIVERVQNTFCDLGYISLRTLLMYFATYNVAILFYHTFFTFNEVQHERKRVELYIPAKKIFSYFFQLVLLFLLFTAFLSSDLGHGLSEHVTNIHLFFLHHNPDTFWYFNTQNNSNKTTVTVLRNTPIVYRGPVFVIQETTNASEPFVGQIVEGGIEMVQPIPKVVNKLPLNIPIPFNESHHEIQDDTEYFAVLVTPETVAQAQISRTTTITLPLSMLLLGVSSRIPWVMVLRRENHYNYLRNPTPMHVSELYNFH